LLSPPLPPAEEIVVGGRAKAGSVLAPMNSAIIADPARRPVRVVFMSDGPLMLTDHGHPQPEVDKANL
jgi:hypothetical protein